MPSCKSCGTEVGTEQQIAYLKPGNPGDGWLCGACWRKAPKK